MKEPTWTRTTRIDADQVQVVEVDGCLAVDAGAGRPERDLSGLRADQPPVFVVGLVGQRVADLLQVEAAQVQHQARIDRSSSCSTGGANARFAADECDGPELTSARFWLGAPGRTVRKVANHRAYQIAVLAAVFRIDVTRVLS